MRETWHKIAMVISEKMNCVNASWEADISLFFPVFISMMKMLLKNKGGCYCKKSSHMENEDDFTKSISRQLSFDLGLPILKL
jgi:hypothetical protein